MSPSDEVNAVPALTPRSGAENARPTTQPTANRTLLLVNANARSGGDDLEDITDSLQELGPLVVPKSLGREATRRAIAHYAPTVSRVVIGGGDGTLHAALPAVLDAGLPLGVLPLGTANDFARSMGITDLAAAIEVILAGYVRTIDIGMVNDIPFLNAIGIGLGPEINKDLDKQSKSIFGTFAYLLRGLQNMRENRGLHAVIECDGATSNVRALQITIGNGIHYGGGMTIAKDASFEDGFLDVLSIEPQSPWRLLRRAVALRTGNTENAAELRTYRGKVVSVRTHKPMDVTADGEQVTRTPVECQTIPGRLQVFAPKPRE